MPKRIPISVAKYVGKTQDCKQVIILAFDGELTHIVTWGKTLEDCSQAADGGNMLKKKWGWPECNDQPARVKTLQAQVNDLSHLLRRCISKLSSMEAFPELRGKVLDYLRRHNLLGSPLRDNDQTK